MESINKLRHEIDFKKKRENMVNTDSRNGVDNFFTYTFMEDVNSYSIKLTNEYTEGDMIIPSTYNNYNVTIIEDYGFLFANIQTIKIPDTITQSNSFRRC
jgi:hypothetical protein